MQQPRPPADKIRKQYSRQYADSSSSFHRVARGNSHRGDYDTDHQRKPRVRCRVSRLCPRKIWAFANQLAVVYRWRYAVTTSSAGPPYPWLRRRGRAANDLVGWNAGPGCGKGQSGGRRNCPLSRGRTRRCGGERRCSSEDSGSTVRLRGSGRSGICTRQREGSVGQVKI